MNLQVCAVVMFFTGAVAVTVNEKVWLVDSQLRPRQMASMPYAMFPLTDSQNQAARRYQMQSFYMLDLFLETVSWHTTN